MTLDAALARIAELEMWLCPHRERTRHGPDATQCFRCAGIIHDPEAIALRRAERSEKLALDLAAEIEASDLACMPFAAALLEEAEELRERLEVLNAR